MTHPGSWPYFAARALVGVAAGVPLVFLQNHTPLVAHLQVIGLLAGTAVAALATASRLGAARRYGLALAAWSAVGALVVGHSVLVYPAGAGEWIPFAVWALGAAVLDALAARRLAPASAARDLLVSAGITALAGVAVAAKPLLGTAGIVNDTVGFVSTFAVLHAVFCAIAAASELLGGKVTRAHEPAAALGNAEGGAHE